MSFSTLDEVARVEKPLLRRQDEKSTPIGRLFNLPIFALCLLNLYYILHLFTVFALTEKRSADDVNFLSGRWEVDPGETHRVGHRLRWLCGNVPWPWWQDVKICENYLQLFLDIFFVLPQLGFGPFFLGVVLFWCFLFIWALMTYASQERCAQTALGGLQGLGSPWIAMFLNTPLPTFCQHLLNTPLVAKNATSFVVCCVGRQHTSHHGHFQSWQSSVNASNGNKPDAKNNMN
jgi:hypothetical protein